MCFLSRVDRFLRHLHHLCWRGARQQLRSAHVRLLRALLQSSHAVPDAVQALQQQLPHLAWQRQVRLLSPHEVSSCRHEELTLVSLNQLSVCFRFKFCSFRSYIMFMLAFFVIAFIFSLILYTREEFWNLGSNPVLEEHAPHNLFFYFSRSY